VHYVAIANYPVTYLFIFSVHKWISKRLKRLKVKGRHLYTATYMNMTSSGLQCS